MALNTWTKAMAPPCRVKVTHSKLCRAPKWSLCQSDTRIDSSAQRVRPQSGRVCFSSHCGRSAAFRPLQRLRWLTAQKFRSAPWPFLTRKRRKCRAPSASTTATPTTCQRPGVAKRSGGRSTGRPGAPLSEPARMARTLTCASGRRPALRNGARDLSRRDVRSADRAEKFQPLLR